MTRDQVRIGIIVSDCYGSEMGIPLYSEEDLMESFDDMYFNNPDFYCEDCISRAEVMKLSQHKPEYGDMIYAFDVSILPSVQPINQNIKALGKELRTFRGGIKDEKVLTGFNMAIALCNKHLADMRGTESEGKECK